MRPALSSDVVLKARPWPPATLRPNFYGLDIGLSLIGPGFDIDIFCAITVTRDGKAK